MLFRVCPRIMWVMTLEMTLIIKLKNPLLWPVLFSAVWELHLLTSEVLPPGHWESRARFKCISGKKCLTSRRDLMSTKLVATLWVYWIFETVCEGQVWKRILALYFILERMIITELFFFNQMEVFMLSQHRHVKLADVTKINLRYLRYFKSTQ